MKLNSKSKSIAIFSLGALFLTSQAFAHTGVRDVVEEGQESFNAFKITHGCGGHEGDQTYPVIGQTALFPFGGNAVWRDSAGTVIQVGGNGLGAISTPLLTLSLNSLNGFGSPFATVQEIVDGENNVRALHWRDGAMDPQSNGHTPFRIKAPMVNDDKCVKSVRVRIGVINWCDTWKNEENDITGPYNKPLDAFGRPIPNVKVGAADQANVYESGIFDTMPGGNGDNNRADWWFGDVYGGANGGTNVWYQDPDLLQQPDAKTGKVFWTTLTINNTSLPASCQGKETEVSVEPQAVNFDYLLRPANIKPFALGTGPL